MSTKPILFNTNMVSAILDGSKTVTRRAVNPQPNERLTTGNNALELLAAACAPYRPGDILYVRETWCSAYDGEKYFYFADKNTQREENRLLNYDDVRWRPSIHMPREAARIFLRVTDVRVERLQNITPEQLRAEGVEIFITPSECARMFDRFGAVHDFYEKKKEFAALWDSTIKPADRALYGWAANPWVWVIEFERCEKPEEG